MYVCVRVRREGNALTFEEKERRDKKISSPVISSLSIHVRASIRASSYFSLRFNMSFPLSPPLSLARVSRDVTLKWQISEGLTAALYRRRRTTVAALLRSRERERARRNKTERPADVQDDKHRGCLRVDASSVKKRG